MLGPYAERAGFRVRWFDYDGVRRDDVFASQDAAESHAAALRRGLSREREQGARTVGAALEGFLSSLLGRGLSPATEGFYRLVLGEILFPSHRSRPVSSLSVADCKAELARWHAAGLSVATQRGYLRVLVRALSWATAEGWCKRNAAEGLRVAGRIPRGKPQLTRDEARRLWRASLAEFWRGDSATSPPALVVALLLRHGLRRGEALDRALRDLDESGAVLTIPTAKTRAGVRAVRLDPALVAALRWYLLTLRKGQAEPSARLFAVTPRVLGRALSRLLVVAQCPRVTPHGLRGTFATLALTEDAASSAVGRALGHTSDKVTREHYYAPGAWESVQDKERGETFQSVRNPSAPSETRTIKGPER